MHRTHTCGELRSNHIGKEVTLSGWVQRRRDFGAMTFIDLRDRYGITQLSFNEDQDKELNTQARSLGREFVIKVKGEVIERSNKNEHIHTGDIEIQVREFEVLNAALTPPFTIEDETDGGEEIRLKYRYLDLRRNPIQDKLILRSKLNKAVRDYLNDADFIDVETPVLIKSTPEGARDFVVPSRMNEGQYYALPQSPQTFKQLLMVSGLDKYYQIVKCFRDEDFRADRHVLVSKGKSSFFSLRLEPIIGAVAPNGNANKAGLIADDKILGIDTFDVQFFDQLKDALSLYKNNVANLKVLRNGSTMTIPTNVDSTGMIGIQVSNLAQYSDDLQQTDYGFFESFPAGYNKGVSLLKDNIIAFGEMFRGKLDPVKSVSGPVGIAKIFGAEWDWRRFWNITGMLSFILAFMNLLPIPALDGGHVLFLLVEMLRGKPLPEKVMYYFQIIGMVILFGLMGFIIFIDFFNAFFG